MEATLDLIYRGPLSSCNYDCSYCPFAKHRSPPEELARDRASVERFVDCIARERRPLTVLFTPWGEALIRDWYPAAIIELSHMSHVHKVAIQTNLSVDLDWLDDAEAASVGLWATHHPQEVSLERFIGRCRELDRRHVRYSVGIVGTRANLEHARALRRAVDDEVYVWVNAYKSEGEGYYEQHEVKALSAIDPLFSLNNTHHPSIGRKCRTGSSAFAIDGDGDVRRCHFVDRVIGNIHREPLTAIVAEQPCPNQTCGCHIGYVHLEHLALHQVFGGGLPERIPAQPIWRPGQRSERTDGKERYA